jgi:hypothetical protein
VGFGSDVKMDPSNEGLVCGLRELKLAMRNTSTFRSHKSAFVAGPFWEQRVRWRIELRRFVSISRIHRREVCIIHTVHARNYGYTEETADSLDAGCM